MSAWSDLLSDAADTLLDLGVFGVPVILPDGSAVQGVLELPGETVSPGWSEIGLPARLEQIPNPMLYLRDASAAALLQGDLLTADGLAYQVAAPPARDGSGLTPVQLMPAKTATGERWQ